jgi:hypothetical protein
LTKKLRYAIIINVRGTKEALEIKERETAKGKQMKAQGNWKAWEKGSTRRIYVGDGIYFERGATGLMSQVGLNASEISFASELFATSPNGADFDKWFETIKQSRKDRPAKIKINDFMALYNAHLADGMTGREAAALAKAGK